MNILEKLSQYSQWGVKYFIGIGFGNYRKYIQVNKQVYENKFLSKFVWHKIDMTPITEKYSIEELLNDRT